MERVSNPKLTKKGGQGEVHIEGARVNTQGLDILRTQKIYHLCGKKRINCESGPKLLERS